MEAVHLCLDGWDIKPHTMTSASKGFLGCDYDGRWRVELTKWLGKMGGGKE
jgi:hypothetical protein